MINLQYCIHIKTLAIISHVFYIFYVINLPKCQKTSFNFETLTSGPTTIHNFSIFRDIIITQKFQPWFLAMFCLASPSCNTIMYNVYYEGKKQQNTFKAREEKNYRKYIQCWLLRSCYFWGKWMVQFATKIKHLKFFLNSGSDIRLQLLSEFQSFMISQYLLMCALSLSSIHYRCLQQTPTKLRHQYVCLLRR